MGLQGVHWNVAISVSLSGVLLAVATEETCKASAEARYGAASPSASSKVHGYLATSALLVARSYYL